MATISFLQTANTGSNLTTYTFSSQNLGTADANRYIIVAVCARSSDGSDRNLNSVTVGGVSATVNANSMFSGNTVALAVAAVPTGTTGDVVVTFSGGMGNCGIGLYRALDLSSTTAFDSATASDADPISANIDIQANGVCVAIAKTDNTAPQCTWTNLTEDYDTADGGGNCMSAASDEFASTQTNLNVQCDFTLQTRTVLAVASYSPTAVATAGKALSFGGGL